MKITIAKMHGTLGLAILILAASFVSMVEVDNASASITIATVPVGNPGNAPDPSTGFGEVDYNYNIGKYDVTSSQYTAFLNAVAATDPYGLYQSSMVGTIYGSPGIIQSGSPGYYTYSVAAGRGNYPVTGVSFWDATRFANWLANGQPIGARGAGDYRRRNLHADTHRNRKQHGDAQCGCIMGGDQRERMVQGGLLQPIA